MTDPSEVANLFTSHFVGVAKNTLSRPMNEIVGTWNLVISVSLLMEESLTMFPFPSLNFGLLWHNVTSHLQAMMIFPIVSFCVTYLPEPLPF